MDFDNTSRELAIGNARLHYHEAGSGPPLILLHGSGPGVYGWANFSGNPPVFAQHFRCPLERTTARLLMVACASRIAARTPPIARIETLAKAARIDPVGGP